MRLGARIAPSRWGRTGVGMERFSRLLVATHADDRALRGGMHAPASETIATRARQAKPCRWPRCSLANIALAFGPWFVRLADVGPVAAGFWRIALAAPVLLAAAVLLGQRPVRQARGLWGVLALGGLAFAADLASWHVGIHHTDARQRDAVRQRRDADLPDLRLRRRARRGRRGCRGWRSAWRRSARRC